MPQLSRIDRVRGCLLGLAVGDALGAPLEGLSAQQIRTHYGQVIDYVDGARAWKRKPYRWRMPGLYSDDTQQALALCDVLLEHGRVDPDRLAELYLALATPKGTYFGAHRGVGRSFRQVLSDLERGVSPRETGQKSAGIGAAMRIAPVALYFNSDPGAMFEAVMAASLMTHRDIRSLAGAMAVSHAVRRLAAGALRDPSFLFRLAADVAREERRILDEHADSVTSLERHGQSLSRAIAHVESLLESPRDRALLALVEEANRHGADPVCRRATMGFPPACIPTCLYLLLATDSYEEGDHRGHQPRRRCRHGRGNPRCPRRRPLWHRRDPPSLARRAPEPRGDRPASRGPPQPIERGPEHTRPDRHRARPERSRRRLSREPAGASPERRRSGCQSSALTGAWPGGIAAWRKRRSGAAMGRQSLPRPRNLR